jgi:predicted amidohydrolase
VANLGIQFSGIPCRSCVVVVARFGEEKWGRDGLSMIIVEETRILALFLTWKRLTSEIEQ